MTTQDYFIFCTVIVPGLIILTVHIASVVYVVQDSLASDKSKLEKGCWIASVYIFGVVVAIQYYARNHPKFDKALQYIALVIAVLLVGYFGGQVWLR